MVLECARCRQAFWDTELYRCDQCGGWVCVDCLAVVGSDNTESVCCECPAMEHPPLDRAVARKDYYDADGLTRADRIADGHMTPEDAEWRAGQAEEQGEDR